jgi:two-component system, OmpR family, sensor histidine kinase MtrB
LRNPVRLRTLLRIGAAFLSLLGVAASSALYLTARAMEQNGNFLVDAVEGVAAAEQVQFSLNRVRPTEGMALADYRAAEAQAVRDARNALEEFPGEYVSTDEERRIFERVRVELDGYLKAVPDGPELVRTARLDAALSATRDLVKLNEAQTKEKRDRNKVVDELGRAVAVTLAGALVIGSVLLLFVLHFAVDRPLAGLREALVRFKGGAREERLPVEGPEELRQIATEFNELADSEARRDRLQLEFLAGVAHDLRGPLNILKLSAQSIAGAPTLPPADRIRASLGRVSAQVDRLARMVDDLLDRTRIEAGNLEMQMAVCDLRPLVEEVADLHRAVTDEHHLEVSIPPRPVMVRGDATRLVQVLTNLVSNAIKYSPDGGAVRLELEVAGREAVLSVMDEGVGIAPEDREHIFEPFHRARRGESGKIPGVGLGLSVSRRLVLAHGGRIEVEARGGGGSVFRVRLPIAAVSEDAGAEPRPSQPH